MSSHSNNYYARSIMLIAMMLGGCASASAVAAGAPVVRFTALGHEKETAQKLGRQPVVISFVTGDHIPLEFGLDSVLFEPIPNPHKLDIEVKRPFFLLMRPDGPPRISLDGKDFDERHKNSFRFGLAVHEGDAHVEVGFGILANSAATK